MKKPFALAPFVFLGLVSASPPAMSGPEPADPEAYPPCSRAVTDRCVQTYERAVRRQALPEADSIVAPDGPPPPDAYSDSGARDYPPCTAARQDRCTQIGRHRAAPTRYAMAERQRIRIGERG